MTGRTSKLDAATQAILDAKLDARASEIWGFVRLNKDSLDSERCVKMIRQLVDQAVENVTEQCETLAGHNERLREMLKAKRKAEAVAAQAAIEEALK